MKLRQHWSSSWGEFERIPKNWQKIDWLMWGLHPMKVLSTRWIKLTIWSLRLLRRWTNLQMTWCRINLFASSSKNWKCKLLKWVPAFCVCTCYIVSIVRRCNNLDFELDWFKLTFLWISLPESKQWKTHQEIHLVLVQGLELKYAKRNYFCFFVAIFYRLKFL